MHPSDTQQLVFDPIVRQTILVSALYLSTALGGVLAFVYGARFGRLGTVARAVCVAGASLHRAGGPLYRTRARQPLTVVRVPRGHLAARGAY